MQFDQITYEITGKTAIVTLKPSGEAQRAQRQAVA